VTSVPGSAIDRLAVLDDASAALLKSFVLPAVATSLGPAVEDGEIKSRSTSTVKGTTTTTDHDLRKLSIKPSSVMVPRMYVWLQWDGRRLAMVAGESRVEDIPGKYTYYTMAY
jgi:hypothetical protein